MSSPIFVTGLPRSGTSVTAGCLAICGAWAGRTGAPTPWNRKGTFENEGLKERFVKPVLAMLGCDPLGLDPLPDSTAAVADAGIDPGFFRILVLEELRRQGWDGRRRWIFKDAKLALIAPLWRAAFPEAEWLVVARPRAAVASSCLRAEPMARRLGYDLEAWLDWAAAYERFVGALWGDGRAGNPVAVVEPDRQIFADPEGLAETVRALGLTWRPREVAAFVEPKLWHGEEQSAEQAA